MLKIAIQAKGRLNEDTLQLLADSGITPLHERLVCGVRRKRLCRSRQGAAMCLH